MCVGRLLFEPLWAGIVAASLLLVTLSSSEAAEPYKLQPGDVLSFSVAAIPNLKKELTVSAEGLVNVPLIGWINAGGLSVREVEEEVRTALPNAIYRQRVDGDELLVVVRADEVSLEITKYRPVYVSGEVASGGEQTYRPEMTVRQAIALAGGLRPSAANNSDEQSRARDLGDMGVPPDRHETARAPAGNFTAGRGSGEGSSRRSFRKRSATRLSLVP